MSEAQNADLRMQVTARVNQDKLSIRVDVESLSPANLYILDGLNDGWNAQRELVMRKTPWSEVRGDALFFMARLVPPPEGRDVETLNIPLPTRLEPRQRNSTEYEIPLPVVTEGPYARPPGRGKSVADLPAYFELGYFLGNPNTESAAVAKKTTQGTRYMFRSIAPEYQKIIVAGPIANLKVLLNA